VACYVSVQKEVETRGIIEYALDSGKQLAVPVTRTRGVMNFQRILSLAGLQADRFGLLEPLEDNAQIILPGELDFVIAPGIAFDRQGNRIGFGGGYYDRFLTQTRAIRVGLAYSFQLVDLLPAETHDVRMDWLVTENEVISCQTNK
jgi:5-formyltetrahydrofolate cyclo-ligase